MTTPLANPRPARTWATVLVAAALVLPSAAPAYERNFAANSLIIPTQMEYQDDCGMISAYGLVYTLLYKNKELLAETPPRRPITIYWAIEPRKQSHHRCDTGTSVAPSYSTPNDNDGCDFVVESGAPVGQPVALLQNNNIELAPFNVSRTSYNATTGEITRGTTTPISSSTTMVKYQGGLWIIDAVDRATVLDLLANDPLFDKFRSGGTCGGLPRTPGDLHQVNIHSARINFRAPVARQMNEKPALIGLVGADYVSILQAYLVNAGLDDIPNARGCAAATAASPRVFPGTRRAGGWTCTGHGVIYDVLQPFTDFVSRNSSTLLGELNSRDATTNQNIYQVLWAPHWEEDVDFDDPCAAGQPANSYCTAGAFSFGRTDAATGTTVVEDFRTNAFKNIAAFGDDGFGIFAECASIASLEGSYLMGATLASAQRRCECLDNSATPACAPYGDIREQNCAAGQTAACGACYSCPAGTSLDASPCDTIRCVAPGAQCAPGYTYNTANNRCYACNRTTHTLDLAANPPECVRTNGDRYNANSANSVGSTPASSAANGCNTGYSLVPSPASSAIELVGHEPTRFKMSAGIVKNGLDSGQYGGAHAALDCTDADLPTGSKYWHAPISGDCMNYHAAEGGPGNIFAQKGNFQFTGTSGHTSHWKPASDVSSVYKSGVQRLVSSTNSDATSPRNDWDFVTARHKDNDPMKGMVVYLAGHDFKNDAGGNRFVLNTMLNLGFSDAGLELSRSEPVGYTTWGRDANNNVVASALTVFQGTYVQRQPSGPFRDWEVYNPVAPHSWRFPYYDGHLRAYPLANITSDWQDFRTAVSDWDAGTKVPRPAARKIFTATAGSANLSWKKVNWDYTQTTAGTCTETSGVTDAAGSNICALSYKLAQCATASVTTAALTADATRSKEKTLGAFVQAVRGYCAARNRTTGAIIPEPADSDCDFFTSPWQRNQPRLGGVDHSSPAIVGPSPYIGNRLASDGSSIPLATRPVVAYVGGRDGMLHAIFVSGTAGWSASGAALPAGITGGTELWAFIPPGQICGLHTNSAMVDANVSVMDVFGNFPRDANGDGVFDLTSDAEKPTGIREWRTILTATAGEGAAEIFALDVTHPLKPVLLWRIAGTDNKDDRFDMNNDGDFADTGDLMNRGQPKSYVNKWFNSNDGTQGSVAWIPTDYNSTNTTVLDGIKSGRYDYRNLGYAFGTATGTIWSGNAFQFVTFVATNTADHTQGTPFGYRGVELYAIDVVTGQKQWQWQNRYTRANAAGTVIADNGIPGRPALVDIDADGSVDRVYVGDMEGHLWELSALDGRNLNYLRDSNGDFRSYPLYGTPAMLRRVGGVDLPTDTLTAFTALPGTDLAQQPLTSPIGVGRFTVVPTALEPYMRDRIVVAQGTMGVDWSIAPTQPGHVYVVPVFPEKDARLVEPISRPSLNPLYYGILDQRAFWDTELGVGERVYAMPKIWGNTMFINTAYGSFTGDMTGNYTQGGRTMQVSAGSTVSDSTGYKRPGGVLIFGDVVVVSSSSQIKRLAPNAAGGTVEQRVRDRATPAGPKTWEQRPDGTPPFLR